MNVFVLTTGRSGSTTFIEACKQITNFSTAHESRTDRIGSDRFDYPDDHIEADNRLSWLLGRLDERFGDDAIYVHLVRDKGATARSFTKRYERGIIKAYRGNGILMNVSEEVDPLEIALDYCDTIASNIALFLKDKTKTLEFALENAQADFTAFWNYIDAEGDLASALSEFDVKHNATNQPSDTPSSEQKNLPVRVVAKLARVISNFPDYVRDV